MASRPDELLEASKVCGGMADPAVFDPRRFPCEAHSDRAAVGFCTDHDSAVCRACADLHHRSCKDVDDIEELYKKEAKGKHFKKFLSELDHVIQKVDRLKRVKHEDLGKLRTETSDALNAITEFRNEINWFLDKLERKGKTFIEKRYKEVHADITGEVDQCEQTMASLNKLQKRVDNLEHKSERLVHMTVGRAALARARRLCSDMKEARPRAEFVKMTVDPLVERLVMRLRWYGKHRTYLSLLAPPPLPHLYRVKHDAHYDVRCRADRGVCHVMGLCQLKDGTLLLADAANLTVKQLDLTYRVTAYCPLPGRPLAVCRTTGDRAAVLLEDQAGRRVLDIHNNASGLALGEGFETEDKCTGITFSDGMYYICTGTTVSEFSKTGEFIRVIYEDPAADICHIHASFHGDRLFVTDATKGLISMDTNGEDAQTFTDAGLRHAQFACSDRSGQVFVCGHDSDNVMQLGPSLENFGELADHKRGLRQPLAVVYDVISNRLVVTQKSRNFIQVYQLK